MKSAEDTTLLSLTEWDQSKVTVQYCPNATLLLLLLLLLLSSLFYLSLELATGHVLTVKPRFEWVTVAKAVKK